jgi:two-component system KDP operon response regulator KdpE
MTGSAVKILVVDDEPPIRRLLRVGLTNTGIMPSEKPTARCRAKACKTSPDLILLDLGLPDMPGHDLLRNGASEGLTCPIVILSSRTDEAGIVKALELGADDYVTKPFGMNELVRAHPRGAAPPAAAAGRKAAVPDGRPVGRSGQAHRQGR